jgi:prepilin-type N-terminal cleavage/methylation domain-containing protein
MAKFVRNRDGMNQLQKGYTLSEILIALAILGICLGVMIPILAQQRVNSAKKAVFKETIHTIQSIIRQGMASDDLNWDNVQTYFYKHTNTIKTCPNNSLTQGCIVPVDPVSVPDWATSAGLVLVSGTVITGLNNGVNCFGCNTANGEWGTGMEIDWNGAKGPNIVGDDRILLVVSYGTNPLPLVYGAQKPDTITPHPLAGQANTNLWQFIWAP